MLTKKTRNTKIVQVLNGINNLQAHYSDATRIEKRCFVAFMSINKEKAPSILA